MGKLKQFYTLEFSNRCDEAVTTTRIWRDEEIAEALNVHRNTVRRVRQRFLSKGERPALVRNPRSRPPTPPKVDGATEAKIIALCCSDPPEGRTSWTIRLLTSELKKRTIVTEISRETVRRTLKKNSYGLEKPRGFVSLNGI